MKPLFALLAFLVTAYYRLRLDPSDYALPLTNLEGWPDFKAPTGRVVGTSRGRVHYTLEGNDTDPLVRSSLILRLILRWFWFMVCLVN